MVFMGKAFKRYLLAGSLPCLYGTKKCNTLPQKNAPPPIQKNVGHIQILLTQVTYINLILPYKPGDTGSKKFTGRREG
jgi:hypothetical protein